MIFINFENAQNKVPREVLHKSLEKKGVRIVYIRAIKDMYNRIKTTMGTQDEISEDFPLIIELHQESTLISLLVYISLGCAYETYQESVPNAYFLWMILS
ncbi:hypothetical protein Lal_00028860 [Lupinus albus]|nr:hypothetical protein Lal_00028860 [Lupinus albus]